MGHETVATLVQGLQQRILIAMLEKETTVLRTFQSLNRASRQRGEAKFDAVVSELTALLRIDEVGADVTCEALKALVRQHDDGDGKITFGEFVAMCGGASTRRDLNKARGAADGMEVAAEVAEALTGKYHTVKQVFTVIDGDRSKKISREELVLGCQKAGLVLSEEEAAALFGLIDVDKSGALTYDEVSKLMEHGGGAFESNKALAAAEAQQSKDVAMLCKSIQEALANPTAMERIISAAQSAATNKALQIDPAFISKGLLPPGVKVGIDDIAGSDALRTALVGPGALSREMASAIISLAPKRVLAHGKCASSTADNKQSFTVDEGATAEEGKFVGCIITLMQSGSDEERVIAEYSAQRQVGVDVALTWAPNTSTRYQISHPTEVCLTEMFLKTHAILQVRKEVAQKEDEEKEALKKSTYIANADLAQIVRGLRKVKADSIKGAWEVFNPQRKPSLALVELASGIERLGLLLHTPSTYMSRDLVVQSAPSGKGGMRSQHGERRVYDELFKRSSTRNLLDGGGAGASVLQSLGSFRDLTATISPIKRASSSGSAGVIHGDVLGCMCENQWICDKCSTWNETGGGYDDWAADRAGDLKDTEVQAKKNTRVPKHEKTTMPFMTLVCTQLQLGKGLPSITIHHVPTAWKWQQMRLELRNRSRRSVNIVFEGELVHDQVSWAKCVHTLQQDWQGSKELLGELAVDLVPILCANTQCKAAAPEMFPRVGSPWRVGCSSLEWCPLAKWQLVQMLRRIDDSNDLQIDYKEFAAVFELMWAMTPQQTDELAANARVVFRGCFFASFVKVKIRQSWELKWAWVNGSAVSFAAALSDHGNPAPRGLALSLSRSLALSLSCSLAHSLTRSLAHSFARSLALSLSRSLALSLTHSLTPSLPRSLALSPFRSLALSLSRSLALSLSRSLAFSLSRSLDLSLFRSLALSLPHSLSPSFSRSLALSLARSLALSLFHSLALLLSRSLALSLSR